MFWNHNVEIANALNELDLNPDHLDVIANRNCSANAPYHNQHHCFTVALNALEGARFYKMKLKEQQILFIAGLYHDFEHSEGKKEDRINIANAMDGMEQWCRKLETFTPETISTIRQAISSTIWPGHLFQGERSLIDLIMCDADILQWTAPDVHCYIHGLSVEKGEVITWEDAIDFVKTHGTKTLWGQTRIDSWMERAV